MIPVGIIGAGPAGLTAAIQLARSDIQSMVYEKKQPGGLLHEAFCVENYPGVPSGIKGSLLASSLQVQAHNHGIEPVIETVHRITFDEQSNGFTVHSSTRRLFHTVILASGTRPRTPPVAIPRNHACVHHSPLTLKNMVANQIGIIGGGDAAFDYAMSLANSGNHVTILHRQTRPRCLPLLRKRVYQEPRIQCKGSYRVSGVKSLENNAGVHVHFESPHEDETMEFRHLLLAIGREPDMDYLKITDFVRDKLEKDGRLLYAGDIQNGLFRQCAIAAGDGCRAAMTIAEKITQRNRRLEEKNA